MIDELVTRLRITVFKALIDYSINPGPAKVSSEGALLSPAYLRIVLLISVYQKTLRTFHTPRESRNNSKSEDT